jgi:hypothetical protein
MPVDPMGDTVPTFPGYSLGHVSQFNIDMYRGIAKNEDDLVLALDHLYSGYAFQEARDTLLRLRAPIAEAWRLIRGHLLASRANRSDISADQRRSALRAVFAFATRFHTFFPGIFQADVAELTGLRALCVSRAQEIRDMVTSDHVRRWKDRDYVASVPRRSYTYMMTISSALTSMCPEVLNTVDLRHIALQNRVFSELMVQILPDNPFQVMIAVRRSNPYSDSLVFLGSHPVALSAPLPAVEFAGEGAEGDGLTSEWFHLAAQELFGGAARNMFRRRAGVREPVYEIDTRGFYQGGWSIYEHYRRAGRFLALSVVQGYPIGVMITAPLLAQILGKRVTLDDMAAEDNVYVERIRQYVLGANSDAELDALGIDIAGQVPTLDNRVALLDEELNVRFEGEAQDRMEGIRDGFRELLSQAALRDVSISDLQSMILGNPQIDVENLIANILSFDDARSRQHVTIQRLFRALRNMSQDQLRQFTRFLTGSPLMPVGGFGTLDPAIKIDAEALLERLPRSSTCIHAIYLPNYASEQTLVDKLLVAIANNHEMEEQL